MRPAWQDEALCAQVDPELWFPPKGKHHPRAVEICFACPVRTPCAEAGKGEEYGIWGGQTRDDQRRMRRKERVTVYRGSQPCGTPAAYRRHLRRGEEACQLCREAEARRQRERYDATERQQRYQDNEVTTGWAARRGGRLGHSLEADGGPSYEYRREAILEGGAA